MLIDCDRCSMRDRACGECVVGMLLAGPAPERVGQPAGQDAGVGPPDGGPAPDRTVLECPDEFDEVERSAIAALVAGGLIPPVRLVCSSGRRSPAAESDFGVTERRSMAG